MFSSSWSTASPTGPSFHPSEPDTFDLAEEYGKDAAATLSRILHSLDACGFPKTRVNSYSAFDRVLSGIVWLLQRLVRREDAQYGRVQWEVLFQSHDKMKPRLGLAQEVRVAVAVEELQEEEVREEDQVNFMAQIANQAAAIASGGGKMQKKGFKMGKKRRGDNDQDFDRQYQKAVKQAMEDQQALLSKRREREAQLLQKVVSVPEEVVGDGEEGRVLLTTESVQSPLQVARTQLKEHEVQVQKLIEEKKSLDAKTKESNAQAAALDEALSAVNQEIAEMEAQTPEDENAQAHLATLRQLVMKNEVLKREKNEFREKCRLELESLKERIEKMKLQVAKDASQQDEETLRLNEIEQMHAQMAQKHKDMKMAAAKQTRALHLKMKQIDEIPTRIELVQYEKRFVELYDEVALTLDETRKYYCVYNTLKTTHEFLEKEISLINSINENFDVAMGSKTATQAFFMQMESIIQNVQGTVGKQQTARGDHQASVETLDSKYQLLLEQERMYVSAIREFQKECEKNEKLVSRIEEMER
ncbi:hypothetical protein JM16_005244 [Phytophthora kernoviae]|uniref:CCDC93 coiled-coil domain-containing protein n=1 Tax=Phytophthora kernoviae TaxID=325452 RepID=A0A8T0LQY2_9STRA|nr:hypothetical protein JM16_005244 [Phytophthora kernoviae]